MQFKIKKQQRNGCDLIDIQLKPYRRNNGKSDVACPADPQRMDSSRVAILGQDFPGVRFQLMAGIGEAVTAGQAVMCDRRRPQIVFTSPVSGIVEQINRGSKRSLHSLVIGQINTTASPGSVAQETTTSPDRDTLISSGIWTTFRTRPFGNIPDPDSVPSAIFVSAIDTRPGALDPESVIQHHVEWFKEGIKNLAQLFHVPIYLCCRPASADRLGKGLPDSIQLAEFSGGYHAGLASTHIQALSPVGHYDSSNEPMAWHVECQDVISIGHLLQQGHPWSRRIIAIHDHGLSAPQVASVPLGGAIRDIPSPSISQPSGPATDAGEGVFGDHYLGLFDRQITVSQENTGAHRSDLYQPLLPTPDLDRLAPPGVLATPFLRALLVGDIDQVRALGGLQLIEEDLALLSNASSTGADYGRLLRQVLEQLHGEIHA